MDDARPTEAKEVQTMLKVDYVRTTFEVVTMLGVVGESPADEIVVCVKITRDNRQVRRQVPLPRGWQDRSCIACGGSQLIGAVITETADEFDPNILCLECLNWWD